MVAYDSHRLCATRVCVIRLGYNLLVHSERNAIEGEGRCLCYINRLIGCSNTPKHQLTSKLV